MSAKSLGTLPVVYAADELQNPLPRTTMLFKDDTNSTGLRNNVSPKIRASAIEPTLYERGRGPTIVISAAKIGWGWKILNIVWVFQGLLADISGLELGSVYKSV